MIMNCAAIGAGAMTDFRPGDYRSAAPARQRSTGPWVFLGVALVLLAGGGWVYQFRPQWVERAYDLAGVPRTLTPAQGDRADIEFGALYQKYGMTPLGASTAGDTKGNSHLPRPHNTPCSNPALLQP